ncbi:hypothetical protein [Tolypothrix sp. VBCCA 56010]|uniref:hypothetical protein n=1 Tax=Tolypothrix sp. VBCCA 56010 TaxID=3137731 RepID=UPI003D7C6C04
MTREYKRNGNVNLFACFQPLAGWRHMELTLSRTKIDFAKQMKNLVDIYFRSADVILWIVDNLNIHNPAAMG